MTSSSALTELTLAEARAGLASHLTVLRPEVVTRLGELKAMAMSHGVEAGAASSAAAINNVAGFTEHRLDLQGGRLE